jgi:hypothetical protein
MREQTLPVLRPPQPAAPSRPSPPLARTVLAVLLLAMAAGQLSDVGGFAHILGTYRLLPTALLVPAAWVLAGAEVVAGTLLLRGRRCGVSLALTVAIVWTFLGIQAFARGLPLQNCGCFGLHLAQPLRWWTLAEDADFVALAAWVGARQRRPLRSPGAQSARSCRGHRLASLGWAGQDGR